jgi:hypothetical protein
VATVEVVAFVDLLQTVEPESGTVWLLSSYKISNIYNSTLSRLRAPVATDGEYSVEPYYRLNTTGRASHIIVDPLSANGLWVMGGNTGGFLSAFYYFDVAAHTMARKFGFSGSANYNGCMSADAAGDVWVTSVETMTPAPGYFPVKIDPRTGEQTKYQVQFVWAMLIYIC